MVGRQSSARSCINRQAGELQRLRNGPPIPPNPPGGPALAVRSSHCRPSSLVRARRLHSRLRRPLPKTARARPAPLPLLVAGPASSTLLGWPAGKVLLQFSGRSVLWRIGSRRHWPVMPTILTGGHSRGCCSLVCPHCSCSKVVRWGHPVLHAVYPLMVGSVTPSVKPQNRFFCGHAAQCGGASLPGC